MAAIDRAQEAEREEVSEGAVFVERMQSDQGGQQQERRLDPLHGVVEGEPGRARYREAQPVGSDDVQIEAGQIDAVVAAQVGDADADAWQSILGEIDQCGSGGIDREAVEGGSAGRDRDGEIKTEPGLANLGRPPITPTAAAVQRSRTSHQGAARASARDHSATR